jgi:hypothetical protein
MRYLTAVLLAVVASSVVMWTGCAGSRRSSEPEADLTPFQQLVLRWSRDYSFRRTVGGDDLVSQSDAIIERPTHVERLHINATFFADTLIAAHIDRTCQDDTLSTDCDSIATSYRALHGIPERFRVEIQAFANLPEPFMLEPLTIYLTDQNGIDYEPVERVFADPILEQQSYLDREVRRYDPYSDSEYRVYEYQHGYEFASRGRAILYFRRVNVVGHDLLEGADAQLTLKIRSKRRPIAEMTWDFADIAREIAEDDARRHQMTTDSF